MFVMYLRLCFFFPDLKNGPVFKEMPPLKNRARPPINAPPNATTPARTIAPTLTFAIGMPCKIIVNAQNMMKMVQFVEILVIFIECTYTKH